MNSVLPLVPNGYSDIAPGHVASVVTCLEMRTKPDAAAVPLPDGVTLEPIRNPELDSYRELFRTIGSDWLWYSRLIMSDVDLTAILADENVEVFVVRDQGRDIGMLELDFREGDSCELVFLGLIAGTTGRGLGRAVMTFATERAWSRSIKRFWLHTCTFDSEAALSFYIRSGFEPFAFKIEVQADPRLTGHFPHSAAPHVPLILPDTKVRR
jgi:GNAT superfamily N-acetyltransferase